MPERGDSEPRATADGERLAGELSIVDLLLVLRRYGGLLWTVAGVLAIASIGFTLLYSQTGRLRVASLVARMDFEGVERDEYPNGLKFSPNDLTAPPVVQQVFERNGVERYHSLADFASRFAVVKAARGLKAAERDYLAAVSDKSLTPETRRGLAADFEARRDAILSVPEFRLSFSAGDSDLPDSLLVKILDELPAEWAQHSLEVRGVATFQVPTLTEPLLSEEDLGVYEFVVSSDLLRRTVSLLIETCDALAQIPGAQLVNVDRDGRTLNLHTLRSQLAETTTLDHQILLTAIRRAGAVRDAGDAMAYLQDRLGDVESEIAEVARRQELLRQALRGYPDELTRVENRSSGASPTTPPTTLIPQFDERFINRILELDRESRNAEYFREISDLLLDEGTRAAALESDRSRYVDLLESLGGRAGRGLGAAARATALAEIDRDLVALYREVASRLESVRLLHQEISRLHLQPRSAMFTIVEPAQVTRRSRPLKRLVVVQIVLALTLLALVALGCLVHDRFRSRRGHAPTASRA